MKRLTSFAPVLLSVAVAAVIAGAWTLAVPPAAAPTAHAQVNCNGAPGDPPQIPVVPGNVQPGDPFMLTFYDCYGNVHSTQDAICDFGSDGGSTNTVLGGVCYGFWYGQHTVYATDGWNPPSYAVANRCSAESPVPYSCYSE